jgi:hypothetical protein
MGEPTPTALETGSLLRFDEADEGGGVSLLNRSVPSSASSQARQDADEQEEEEAEGEDE